MIDRIAKLPIDERGYPVPYFVQWLTPDNKTAPAGEGRPEFRMMDSRKFIECTQLRLCWVCGEQLGRIGVFVIGPMCAINRTSGEPPSHADCAYWSVRGCPFLTKPQMVRREHGLPEERNINGPGGVSIQRNPGVALMWPSKDYYHFRVPNGILFNVGNPIPESPPTWWSAGRPATREEVIASIDTGFPKLVELCSGPDDLHALDQAKGQMWHLLPS